MNWLQFASTLVEHLAWPVVVLVTVLIFRRPLKTAIARIQSYESLIGKLTFGDQLAQVEVSIDHFTESVEVPKVPYMEVPSAESNLPMQVDASPAYMITMAWVDLMEAVVDLGAAALGGDSPAVKRARTNPRGLLAELTRTETVNEYFVEAFFELKNLRNRVAHGEHNPTQGEAVTYVEAAIELARTALALAVAERAKRRSGESGTTK